MAVLEIDGLEIPVSQLDEREPVYVGGRPVRAANGAPIRQAHGLKRTYIAQTTLLEESDFDDVRDKVEVRTAQTIDGDEVDIDSGRTRIVGTVYQGERKALQFEILEV